ncbi:MAG TPA: 2-dehydropantoate 2-reductase N-terminal domain-containing protein, partial [bacterium]|nr:2-dehydropantoate 2-reductase N-terminal domain-containing protein [bacterium]
MKICILGAGSWGIALTIHLKRAGHHPTLWAYKADQAVKLSETRENKILLPGAVLPADVLITYNLGDALTGVEGVVMAVPSQSVRSTCWEASPFIDRGTWVVCAAK